MSKEPLVTVVIPTWNRLPLLEEAIESVVAQTYPNWQLIVVDDGSTDGTADRLRAIEDKRVQLVTSPHIGHIGRLRNLGAQAGSGELIAFLDSDDLWLPPKLERQVGALQKSSAGWCYSDYELIDASGHPIPKQEGHFRLLSGNIVQHLLMFDATVATPTLLVRRAIFEAAGKYSEHPRLLVSEDYEMYLRLAACADVVALPDSLVKVRRHSGNTDERRFGRLELRALVYELFLDRYPRIKDAGLARRLWTRSLAELGAQQLSAGKIGRAAQLFGRSALNGAEIWHWGRALARGMRDGVLGRRACT